MAPLARRIDAARAALEETGVAAAQIRCVVSPYRICPLGAHVDHQRGVVLGQAIGLHTLLAFAPGADAGCRLTSGDFAGELHFDLRDPGPAARRRGRGTARRPGRGAPGRGAGTDWRVYARAAAWALRERLPARPRGIVGRVRGDLPGAGLSSSASVLLAYLLALADANDLALDTPELVALSHRAESEFVGLASGILDPASIAAGRRDHLLAIDCAQSRWEPLAAGDDARPWRILIVFSGTTRSLTATGFNERVAECREAARRIARAAGLPDVAVLGDLPEDVLSEGLSQLPEPLRRRARHFEGERQRVRAGIDAWVRGDLERFGRLMGESCQSSIECYETGSAELVALQRLLAATPGVLGARFSGGGYGGSSVALVAAEEAERARDRVEHEFVAAFPGLAGRARAFLVESDDGARLQ